MNYSGDVEVLGTIDDPAPRRRRRWWLLAAVIAVVLVIGLLAVARHRKPAAADASAAAPPPITVMAPGRTATSGAISATGSLAARREMPVGVAGEGGMVSRVLVDAGDWVKAGQTLATIDQSVQARQAEQLAAQIRAAEANAALAQSDLDRAQKLVSRGFISRADIDTKSATRDAMRAQVDVSRAQLAQTRAQIGRLDIRAPAAGLVLTRGVEPGQVVSSGSGMLFRIAKDGEMELQARLPEADMVGLHAGAPAVVTPVGSDRAITGQVWQVSPTIDPNSRQGFARVALRYDPALRPGGFASATITKGSIDAPLVPQSAVLDDDQGNYVYVVGAGNKVERRTVRTGGVVGDSIAITSGLNGTEHVVVSAGPFLNPGETVKPQLVAARHG